MTARVLEYQREAIPARARRVAPVRLITTLRSQTPQGVEQERSGLLVASFAVRTLM